MQRVIEAEKEYVSKDLNGALNKFFRAFPGLEYWREMLEYMEEHGQNFDSDEKMADGTYNKDWCWAVHLDINECVERKGKNMYYICIIERA